MAAGHDGDALAQAALDAVQIPLRAAQRSRSMVQLALAGAARFEQWRHYPAGDACDARHGSQFYYHAHAQPRSPGEHGHFHLFLREDEPVRFHHLIALSLDPLGRPLCWFTTNRWVTGEQWLPAEQLLPRLHGFALHRCGRLAPVARWLQALVRLHSCDIEQLLWQRDAALRRRSTGREIEAVFEDRRIQLLSAAAIDLPRRLSEFLTGSVTHEGDKHHVQTDFVLLAAARSDAVLGQPDPGRRIARSGGRQRLASGKSGRSASL